MPQLDLTLQTDLAIRMILAAVLGAAIGFEREIHEHPAGMRTHLLVSLGSAIFTILSIYGFELPSGPGGTVATDTSRVAAQIVSGIGFLGAGAILKYGTSIRGLTTAASLWSTAAIGMATGAGEWVIAAVGTLIILLSLWPLNALIERLHQPGTHAIKLRLEIGRLEALGDISRLVADRHVDMAGVNSQRLGKGRYEVELELRLPANVRQQDIIGAITRIPDVDLMESVTPGD
ncbi:MAG TPA: MgtC/SapB family protein [Candidatus Limnocylindrales bacterium]|nr:MgtC/SapB family protein [Candidatus Limnocylindrales bacterium]